MKKFFVAMLAAFAIIVSCGQSNRAEAYDLYVGNFSNDLEAYIMTETLEFKNMRIFSVRVKSVNRSGKLVDYVEYQFWGSPGKSETYSTSDGDRGTISSATKGTLAHNIYDYAMEVWNDKVANGR